VNDISSSPRKSDASRVVGPLWQRRWLILAIVVLATAGAYVASSLRQDRFRAAATVLVESSTVSGILGQQPSVTPERDTANQAQLIVSRAVADAVVARLRLHETPEQLLQDVSAAAQVGSNFVTVTAERDGAAQAAQVANAFVSQYLAQRAAQVNAEIDSAVADARRQAALLPATPAGAQQRRELQAAIGRLQAGRTGTASQARSVDPATVPGSPFSPRPLRDALFAFVISLLFAIALVYALERFDRRLKRPEDAGGDYGVPLLGTVPHVPPVAGTGPGGGADHIGPELLEPFRWLRMNIDLAAQRQTPRTLLVTSAMQGEGKSTVVRNLAAVYRESGLRVCVVEADVRQPALCELFGVPRPAAGLTTELAAGRGFDDVLIELDDEPGGLSLLPSGPPPPNPQAALLAALPLVAGLAAAHDLVIFDTPPILAAGDAVPLCGLVDDVVVVGRIGLTTSDAAERLMTELGRVPDVHVLGVVVNDLRAEPGASAGYGYGYGYGKVYGAAR
jgi:capsular exopolysaccharide synthesis family protein